MSSNIFDRDLCQEVLNATTLQSLINEQSGINEQGGINPARLYSNLINEQGGIFHLLRGNLRVGWKKYLKNISKHACLLGTVEYQGEALPNLGSTFHFIKCIDNSGCTYSKSTYHLDHQGQCIVCL